MVFAAFGILTSLVILIGGFITYIYIVYPPDTWPLLAVEKLEPLLNSDVYISDIHPDFSGSFTAAEVIVYDAEPDGKNLKAQPETPQLIHIENLSLLINPVALWQKRLSFLKIHAKKIEVFLKDRKSEKYPVLNWARIPAIAELYQKKPQNQHKKTEQADTSAEKQPQDKPAFSLNSIEFYSAEFNQILLHAAAKSVYRYQKDFELSFDSDHAPDFWEVNVKARESGKKTGLIKAALKFNMPSRDIRFFDSLAKTSDHLPHGSIDIATEGFDPGLIYFIYPLPQAIGHITGDVRIDHRLPEQVNRKLFFEQSTKEEKTAARQQAAQRQYLLSSQNLHFDYKGKRLSLSGSFAIKPSESSISSKSFLLGLSEKNTISGSLQMVQSDLQSADLKINSDIMAIAGVYSMPVKSGHVSGNLSLSNTGKQLNIDGRLNIKGLNYKSGGLSLVENASFVIHIKDNHFQVPPVQVTSLGHLVSLSFSGVYAEKLNIKYNLKGKMLDLSKVLSGSRGGGATHITEPEKQSVPENNNKAFSAPGVSLQGNLSFDTVKYNQLTGFGLSAGVSLINNRLKLADLKFNFYDAKIDGSYQLNLAGMGHNFKLRFLGLDVSKLLNAYQARGSVSGKFSGVLTGSMQGSNPASFKKSMNASLRIVAERGRVINTFFQRGFISGVLGPIEDKLKSIEYRRFSTELSIHNGNLNIRHARWQSDQWDIKLLGQSDFDYRGSMTAILRFNDGFIQGVGNPLHLGINAAKSGEWYVLPFACTGDLTRGQCWQKQW